MDLKNGCNLKLAPEARTAAADLDRLSDRLAAPMATEVVRSELRDSERHFRQAT